MEEAIQWYRRRCELDPKNADASTDLGISLYYTQGADEALAQFEHSLKISPKHTKTLLNKGIVLAFGKQRSKAAAAEWEKVVDAGARQSGRAGRRSRALEGVAAAHAGGGATSNQ